MMATANELLEYETIVLNCKIALRGKNPDIQSAALGELLALWLAGHPDVVREEMFEHWIALVRTLVESVEGELFAGKGHPQNLGLAKGGMA
jgi:hypothetical protein